jgi:flagellar protein FlaG
MVITNNNSYTVNIQQDNGIKVAKNHVNLEPMEDNRIYSDFQENNSDTIDSIVSKVNENLQNLQESLEFSFDEDKSRFNFVLKDKVTGDVIRQYPTEDIIKLDKQIENIMGAIVDKES